MEEIHSPPDLNHVLQPVRDPQVAVAVEVTDVAGVEVSAPPQCFRPVAVLQVAVRGPRGTEHHFPGARSIGRERAHRFVDHTQVHQRDGSPGLAAQRDLRLVGQREGRPFELGDGEHRPRLRHPVPPEDVDATVHGRACEARGHRRASDDHLPAAQVDLAGLRGVQQHVQDGRHAVRERHPLAFDQAQQLLGLVASGIDLLDPEQGGDEGHAPSVDVEHRSDGHVDVVAVQPRVIGAARERAQRTEGVQHELAVGVPHALRVAGGPGGVERGRPGPLVEDREPVAVPAAVEQRLVVGRGVEPELGCMAGNGLG